MYKHQVTEFAPKTWCISEFKLVNAFLVEGEEKAALIDTGCGIGDIAGIIKRLDYLQKLGIDGIWLSPVCQSPQVDNGYDISDYQGIYPVFGTMEDMENLICEAEKRDISIIMDLVLNHSSDQHPYIPTYIAHYQ